MSQSLPPSLSICKASDNSRQSSLAIPGDGITVTVTASEHITTPLVLCGRVNVTMQPAGNPGLADLFQSFSGKYIVSSGYSDGNVTYIASAYEDVAGNADPVVTDDPSDPSCRVSIGERVSLAL